MSTFDKVNWAQSRRTPGRLAVRPVRDTSRSVLDDPGYEDRRSKVELLNILSGLPGAEIALAKGLGGLGALAGVVKPKGGNWLTGSVEDALKGLYKNNRYVTSDEALRMMAAEDAGVPYVPSPEFSRQASINSWIEGPLTKYVKTRMASPDDEVRRLAEQGVLHFDPRVDEVMRREARALSNRKRGNAAQGGALPTRLGQSPLAQSWETLSDAEVTPGTYRSLMPGALKKDHPDNLRDMGGEFAVQNPEASAYMFGDWSNTGANRALGFPHLIDELSNALNPTSGLPRNLQLTPEAMKQLSMEKAVRRVADINAWRAAQKVEANRRLAEQASLVREYAENNPKGLRWVELKEAEAKLPEGYSIHPDPKNEGYVTIVDPQGRIAMGGASEREAIGLLNRQERRQALADQLKYEGDTMGHCVGGYCDDVLGGRARIFSLRDAKGEPHVTVEVKPAIGESGRRMGSADLRKLLQENPRLEDEYYEFLEKNPAYEGQLEDWFMSNKQKPADRIVQIKGKQNKAPNEEYLPFVQDFVRNSPLGGKWSEVGDLGNTGLFNLKAFADRPTWSHDFPIGIEDWKRVAVTNPEVVADKLRRLYPDADYITPGEFRAILPEGFAQGGQVRTAQDLSWNPFE